MSYDLFAKKDDDLFVDDSLLTKQVLGNKSFLIDDYMKYAGAKNAYNRHMKRLRQVNKYIKELYGDMLILSWNDDKDNEKMDSYMEQFEFLQHSMANIIEELDYNWKLSHKRVEGIVYKATDKESREGGNQHD